MNPLRNRLLTVQKYVEELLEHRDRELEQLKIRYDTLKGEREHEIVQMENIILELQLELCVCSMDICQWGDCCPYLQTSCSR